MHFLLRNAYTVNRRKNPVLMGFAPWIDLASEHKQRINGKRPGLGKEFFLFIFFNFTLFEGQVDRDPPFTGSLPEKAYNSWGSKARSQELNPAFLCGGRNLPS